MKPFHVVMPDGKTYDGEVSDDATETWVNAQVSAKWRAEREETAKHTIMPQDDPWHIPKLLVGAHQPENLKDWVILAGATGPTVARAAPYVARALTPAAISGTRALVHGEGMETAAITAALDGLVGGLTEGVMTGAQAAKWVGLNALGQNARDAAIAQKMFENATKSPHEVYKQVAAHWPKGRLVTVPSLAPRPITLRTAVNKLVGKAGTAKDGLMDAAYQKARGELVQELSAGGLRAGEIFEAATSDVRYVPRPASLTSSAAQRANELLESSKTRSAAQAAVGTHLPPEEGGMSIGEMELSRLLPHPGERRPAGFSLPGMGVRAIEEALDR